QVRHLTILPRCWLLPKKRPSLHRYWLHKTSVPFTYTEVFECFLDGCRVLIEFTPRDFSVFTALRCMDDSRILPITVFENMFRIIDGRFRKPACAWHFM